MLRDYQVDISNKANDLLHTFKIAYLSMQVRTGKTLTALETAKKFGAKKVVFITKKKAISSINDDYCNFGYVDSFDLYLNNFEQLHHFDVTDVDLFIIDEAHSLGQYPIPSLRTKQLKKICTGKPIIFLSGTPSPESYSQIFNQLWVSSFSPFKEKNFYEWARKYVAVAEKFIFNRKINDYSNADQMEIDIWTQHLFIPFTQIEAGFEQLVQEHVHTVKMSEKTYAIISKLKRDKVITGKNGQVIEADTAVKLMNKMHQIYSGTVIFDENPNNDADASILDTTKMSFILEKFKGKKIAIFYKFKAEDYMIRWFASKEGLKITNSPEEFNSNTDMLFVSQFVSGREGINLSSADALICINIDYSAVTYLQVRARLQTKDRETPAEVHWIFAENGIEHDIYNRVKNKENYTLSYFKKSFYNN